MKKKKMYQQQRAPVQAFIGHFLGMSHGSSSDCVILCHRVCPRISCSAHSQHLGLCVAVLTMQTRTSVYEQWKSHIIISDISMKRLGSCLFRARVQVQRREFSLPARTSGNYCHGCNAGIDSRKSSLVNTCWPCWPDSGQQCSVMSCQVQAMQTGHTQLKEPSSILAVGFPCTV